MLESESLSCHDESKLKQVSGGAGDYQVEGAKTFGTLNFGGSTATTVSFVVGSAEEF